MASKIQKCKSYVSIIMTHLIITQGLKKQNEWIESIQAAVEEKSNTIDKDVKSLLDGIMTFDNIPRKKPKFINFVKNVIGGGKRCSPATIEKVS